jgi:hypothetical protein
VSARIPSRRSVRDTTLYDKVCQWLATGLWFSACSAVFSTNKTEYNWNIVESGVKRHNHSTQPYNKDKLHSQTILIFRPAMCIL